MKLHAVSEGTADPGGDEGFEQDERNSDVTSTAGGAASSGFGGFQSAQHFGCASV